MKPGKELDTLVAEKVMGLHSPKSPQLNSFDNSVNYLSPKPYSTDITAAWEIVEKMKMLHNKFLCGTTRATKDNQLYIGVDGPWASFGFSNMPFEFVSGETIPHAICLAALMAQGFKS